MWKSAKLSPWSRIWPVYRWGLQPTPAAAAIANVGSVSPKTYRHVVGEWLMNDRIYGLGDWSVENHLTALVQKGLIRETNGVLVET